MNHSVFDQGHRNLDGNLQLIGVNP